MRRIMCGLVVAGMAVGIALGQAPKGDGSKVAESKKPIAPTMVPDPSWTPAVGDEATVNLVPIPAAQTMPNLERYMKFRKAGDAVGMRQMIERKLIALVDDRAAVLVIDRHDFGPSPQPSRVLTGDQVAQQALAASRNHREYPPNILEVRFVSGPLRDELRFVPEDDVARLVPKPPESKAKKSKKGKRSNRPPAEQPGQGFELGKP